MTTALPDSGATATGFSAGELDNILNSVLDFHVRGKAIDQNKQAYPAYTHFFDRSNYETFPGGKGDITFPVRGTYQTIVAGYESDDVVDFVNPTPTKRGNVPWKEHHAGIFVTHSELKMDGISVTDPMSSTRTSEHADRDLVVLTGMLDEKLYDMTEGYKRGMQGFLWDDGTTDPKAFAGILAYVVDDPATGAVAGIDPATNTWWRNRSNVAAPITVNPANGGALAQFLQKEYRQLRRYGGNPTLFFAGSDFIGGLETECRANGYYTDSGFNSNGKTELGMADIRFKGVPIRYDPFLDDLGMAKRGYWLDPNHIKIRMMTGEDQHIHTPARPVDQYVLYRSITTTCAMVADMRRCHGVYVIA